MSDAHNRRLIIVALLLAGFAAFLVTNDRLNPTVGAFSAGPPPGYTHAPGEEPEACAECHLSSGNSGTGQISITAPPTYVPGQTYQITVTHTNADPTRQRWGFQLTALNTSDEKAGTLQSTSALTQVITGGPGGNRQYVEHTSSGTFFGQQGGASWTFNWTAPSQDVGAITFYVAGNHANGDGNSSGDHIYFTFAASQPAAASPPELRFEQGAADPNQAAAFDSLLLTRDPFRVQNVAEWWNLGSDTKTRVMIFGANLGSGSVVVNLVDTMNNNLDIPADDVRPVPNSDLSQIIFRLPNNLAAGTCTVKIKAGSQVSNAGTFRVAP